MSGLPVIQNCQKTQQCALCTRIQCRAMPPNLDLYVLSDARDRSTIGRFVDAYVDIETCNDRGDEELMMMPLGAVDQTRRLEDWDWEPSGTLNQIIERGVQLPARGFFVHLTPLDATLVGNQAQAFSSQQYGGHAACWTHFSQLARVGRRLHRNLLCRVSHLSRALRCTSGFACPRCNEVLRSPVCGYFARGSRSLSGCCDVS
jgi:hypothetical protein